MKVEFILFQCQSQRNFAVMRFQTVHTPTSLTEGPISQALISFAFPLLLGNLFQQLYNTADSLIVGNFLGSEALAAVSSSGNLIFLMVGLVNGISMGAGAISARRITTACKRPSTRCWPSASSRARC